MSRIGNFIKTRPIISAMICIAVVATGATAVSAQYGAGGWGHHGPGWRGARMDRAMRFERFCGAEIARYQPVARAYIKADLNLNAGQSGEFDKLADVIAPAMEQIKQEVCGNFGPNAAKVTAPEKLEKLAASLRKAADAAEKAVGPAKSFYAQLDDKQKARVEEVSERRRMAHRGDRDGRGWGRGGPGYGGPGQGGPGQGGPGSGQGPWAPGGPFHPGSQQ